MALFDPLDPEILERALMPHVQRLKSSAPRLNLKAMKAWKLRCGATHRTSFTKRN